MHAIYLYGITILCRGAKDIGKTYIDKIGWKKKHKPINVGVALRNKKYM